MKKYLIFASAAILALAGCAKEIKVQAPVDNSEEIVLTFTSAKPEFESEDETITRTSWNSAKSCIEWDATDKIRVGYTLDGDWMGQEAAGTAKFYASKEVTIDDEDNKSIGTFQVPITGNGTTAFTDPSANGTYKFYGIYPSTILTNTTVNDPTAQNVTLAANQTPGSNTFDHTADIMVGESEDMALTGLPTDPIELNWNRVVGHVALTFSNMGFVGNETPNKITLTFNEAAKVAGTFSINITDGTIGAGTANEIILEGSGLSVSGSSINAWATVLPVSFSSLNVEIKTDKATYTRNIASFNGGAKTFKKNARNTLTVNMQSANREAATQFDWVETPLASITSSDVFVIVGNNGNTYAMSNDKAASAAPDAIAVTVANNKLSVAPADKIQWNLSVDEGNYTFYPNGTTETWLYCNSGTGNKLRVGNTATRNTFTLDATTGYLKTTDSNFIGIYNSADWRVYASTTGTSNIKDQTFAFYVKTTSGPAVTWNLESIAITTAPTKTVYTEGQSFDPAGMVVTGHFVDADDNTNTKDEAVTGYTITPDGALSTSDDHVTITYQGETTTQTITVNAAPAGNDGSLEHPYTASEASALAKNGDTGSYYISGIVTKIQNQYDANYGTANFWIDENGTDQSVFEGYKIKYFGDVNWVASNAEIALNDEVIIYGTLTMYNTTPETSSGYLVSLNGKTKGLTLAAPTVTTNASAKQITVAWTAATGTESAVSYVINCGTQSYNANAAGSHTFTMADYGTYSVSVEATASDAVAATINTSATLTDPSAGAPTLQYTLDGTDTTQGTNGYATNSEITQSNIGWIAVANTTINPWRFGGKNLSGQDRAVYSTTAIASNISSIEVESGTATATVNSLTITVHNSAEDAASGSNAIATKSVTSGITSSTVTLTKTDATSWAGKYYRIVYNVNCGGSNQYVQFKSAKFYSTN